MAINVFPIRALQDNYIWCLHNQQQAVVVDPGESQPVLDYCQQHGLTLSAILITHHHWDHTNGIDQLLTAFPNIPVWGPYNPKITQITQPLAEADQFSLDCLGLDFDVLEVPGHTLDHIAFYSKMGLFCGDTLFSAGCGRLFEGSAKQMYQSLSKLMALPKDTVVYCTHEYTLANIEFAEQVEPNNQDLRQYKHWAQQQRDKNLVTLPSSIGQELAINPFVRCHQPEVIANATKKAGKELVKPSEVFASLRSWKDNF